MSKVIHTILNLKDNMSKGLVTTSKKVSGLSKEMQRAAREAATMVNSIKRKADQMAKTATKFTLAGAAVAGAFAFKTGFTEALNLEGYKMQLETATKDTLKASKIMKFAIDLANRTPFEGGELVGAAAKFEAMGMSAEYWLTKTGDMAAATNKGVDQATEALIDAQTGELERLKEFGITKAMISDKADKMFKNQQVVNNKGQITDLKKFNEALVAIMDDKFTGGMDKQSKTLKGMWSTITGITKSGLASILGMGEDGTIKAGSFLEKLKEKVTALSDKFTQWQQDGTIDKIAQKASELFSKLYDGANAFVNFMVKNKETIKFVGAVGVSFLAVSSSITALIAPMKGLIDIFAIFNGLLSLGAAGGIIIGITALVAAGYLLYKNWDKIKEWFINMWQMLLGAWQLFCDDLMRGGTFIKELAAGPWTSITTGLTNFWEWCIEKFTSFKAKLKEIWQGIKDFLKNPIQGVVKLIKKNGDEPEPPNNDNEPIGKNALGTSYWKGGKTRVNERGGEIIDLPSGSRVIPHDKSQKTLGGHIFKINVVVQGNLIGNKEYADYMGNVICGKIVTCLNNM
ncbi:MAG: hypothetical protein RSF40_11030 [Oscillospiraceae bacterium]